MNEIQTLQEEVITLKRIIWCLARNNGGEIKVTKQMTLESEDKRCYLEMGPDDSCQNFVITATKLE